MVKGSEDPVVALVLRGDHELNELKAEKHPLVASPLTWADEDEVKASVGCAPGSIGVVDLKVPVIADRSAVNISDFVCGANTDDVHLQGVNWGRDCSEPEEFDLRTVVDGDVCSRATTSEEDDRLSITRGIEVGHIFQLGQKYSEPLGANCLDSQGKAVTMTMGTYGIGISRIVAAAIEQNFDDNGIIWPQSIAPFEIVITTIGYNKSELVQATADKLYDDLRAAGIDALLDDRKERPGIMFADSDLIGIPHRVVIGEKSLERGEVEYKGRRDSENQALPLEKALAELMLKLA